MYDYCHTKPCPRQILYVATVHFENNLPLYKSVVMLGFWSALLVTIEAIVFFVSLLIADRSLMFGSSLLLAPTLVTLMVSIHHYAAPEKKVWS